MNFRHWFFMTETATTKQTAWKLEQEIMSKLPNWDQFEPTLSGIKDGLKTFIRTTLSPSEAFTNLLFNFYWMHILKSVTARVSEIKPNELPLIMTKIMRNITDNKDYLGANQTNNQLKSLLNTETTEIQKITALSDDWHDKLKNKDLRVGGEGDTLIDLGNIGWEGWKWLSLNKKYCPQEKKAGGHCGNEFGKTDDNILSLRDQDNRVHATFIINHGVLGEMKGRNNQKPDAKYHPAIVQLLLNPVVKTIYGGGFEPENNFELKDLDEQMQKKIMSEKPALNLSHHLETTDGESIKKFVDIHFGTHYEKIEGRTLYIKNFNRSPAFLAFLKNYTPSKIKVKNLEFLEDFESEFEPFNDEEIGDYIFKIGKEARPAFVEYAKKFDPEIETIRDVIDLFDPDNELDINEFSELVDIINDAYGDAMRSGAFKSAYNDFASTFSEPSELCDAIRCKIDDLNNISITFDITKLSKFDVTTETWVEKVKYFYEPQYEQQFDREQFTQSIKGLCEYHLELLNKGTSHA